MQRCLEFSVLHSNSKMIQTSIKIVTKTRKTCLNVAQSLEMVRFRICEDPLKPLKCSVVQNFQFCVTSPKGSTHRSQWLKRHSNVLKSLELVRFRICADPFSCAPNGREMFESTLRFLQRKLINYELVEVLWERLKVCWLMLHITALPVWWIGPWVLGRRLEGWWVQFPCAFRRLLDDFRWLMPKLVRARFSKNNEKRFRMIDVHFRTLLVWNYWFSYRFDEFWTIYLNLIKISSPRPSGKTSTVGTAFVGSILNKNCKFSNENVTLL